MPKEVFVYQEAHFRVLRLLEGNPQMNQRDMAVATGLSLGKTNYCINALLEKGLIKVQGDCIALDIAAAKPGSMAPPPLRKI